MGQAIEISSEAVRKMDEEDLRWLYLIQLNGHYEDMAGAEVFNKSGRTDIIIKSREKTVFIAECKFWKTKRYFLEGIDQLLDYLSWRDTKTSYMVFCKNKGFTSALSKAMEYLWSHQNFIKEVKSMGESSLMCKFRQKDDPDREIFLTLQMFHVPQDKWNPIQRP